MLNVKMLMLHMLSLLLFYSIYLNLFKNGKSFSALRQLIFKELFKKTKYILLHYI